MASGAPLVVLIGVFSVSVEIELPEGTNPRAFSSVTLPPLITPGGGHPAYAAQDHQEQACPSCVVAQQRLLLNQGLPSAMICRRRLDIRGDDPGRLPRGIGVVAEASVALTTRYPQ